jgi:hypothetical protein
VSKNIIKKKHIEMFWVDATPEHIAKVMRLQKLTARFRDSEKDDWFEFTRFLVGCEWINSDHEKWLDDTGRKWEFCQVYEPQKWWLERPAPGLGWRLLKKFPHETKQPNDEFWSPDWKAWVACGTDEVQLDNVWYRRRVEVNVPSSSDGSRSRDVIPSGWRLLGKDEDRLASDLYWSQGCNEWLLIGDDRVAIANELPKWHAIRQLERASDFCLVEGFNYKLPNGWTVRVTAKGFEVL